MKVIQENNNIDEILTALKNGAVLVLPTDTVYGLVCDAANEKAVEKIFEIKNRDRLKPLAIFVKDIKQAKNFAFIDEKQVIFLKEKWPGAVTVILKAKKGLSSLVYKNDTIGLRMPNYEFLNLILEKFGEPLAQTSANISGLPAINKIKEVLEQFNGQAVQPDLIIDAGDLPNNKPSTIIDLTKDNIQIIR